MPGNPGSIEPDFQSTSRGAGQPFVLRDIWLIQAVALVLILIEDSFMHTFHNAPPVRDHQCSMASRPRRARPRPFPSSSCAALTCHALWKRNPPGGDAVAGPADG